MSFEIEYITKKEKQLKKIITFLCALLITANSLPVKFEFQKSTDLPAIHIKVVTMNKHIADKKISAGERRPVEIEVLGGDEIAELTIQRECESTKGYCEKIDEIYIAYPKPPELEKRPSNPEQLGYIEKMRRYDEPKLRGKTRFSVSKAWGIKGFFNVEPL